MRNVLGFHNPDEEYGFLSNWYLSEFTVDGVKFSSMEQYMMYKKAMLFQDIGTACKILNIQDVGQIKALGRQVKNYNDIMWNGRRQVVIYQGLMEKFCQNPKLKRMLLETGDAILAECAVRDIIWGIGLSMTDEKRFSLSQWRGQNLLGFALMEVREKISASNM